MSDNSKKNKELSSIEDNLNRLSKGLTRFSGLRQVGEGQYQMDVHLNPDNANQYLLLSSKEDLQGLVTERKASPNSLLGKITHSSEVKDLQKRLYNAGLKDILKAVNKGDKDVQTTTKEVAKLNERFRDILRHSNLDLWGKPAVDEEAFELYKRSEEEYLKTGVYGTVLDLLSNFAATGFHNEIAEPDIKEYYDSWALDTNFLNLVIKIFHNLFKYSVAYVLPAEGSYEPHPDGISSIPGKEPDRGTAKAKIALAIKKACDKRNLDFNYKKFDKCFNKAWKEEAQSNKVPIAYTLLDPKHVKIKSSVYGGETLTVTREGLANIRDAFERNERGEEISDNEKKVLKLIPSDIRKAIEADEDYVDKKGYIHSIYLRKNDFEAYSKPRGARVFDSFDYKEELKKADFATLDGVFNYILKVTVGDKDNPVTDVGTLNSLAEAFNTPQKAFTVVWNHTLNVEKITSQEVGSILGKAKYEPVNDDISAALGFSRALIDGESVSAAAGILSSKAVQSEINLARSQVTPWIYKQYRTIASIVGFSSYPAVRWAQAVITTDGDAVTRASWQQMVDRQLVSRTTAMTSLGLDPRAEIERLREERELINEGIGIQGSPFQQSPSGDQGRPKGQPTSEKKPVDPENTVQRQTKPASPSQQVTEASSFKDIEELKQLADELPEEFKKALLFLLQSD